METTVELAGIHYLPYLHTFNVDTTPHVSKESEAIWPYIASSLLAQPAAVLINTWSLSI